jgi:thymidylate synthase (FAD)
MKVRLINYTKDPEKIVAQSARLCYSALGIEELREKLSDESIIIGLLLFPNKAKDMLK